MRGVWIYYSFPVVFVFLVIGIWLQNRVLVALSPTYGGIWLILLTWILTTDEDEAFELRWAMWHFKKRYRGGWSWPWLNQEPAHARHHEQFENHKWKTRFVQFSVGALFLGVGVWWLVKALGESGAASFW